MGLVSRVTTLTLPDEVYRALVAARRRRGEPMAAIIRRALDRELKTERGEAPGEGSRRRARRGERPPRSVLDWLRAPAGSFSHLDRQAAARATDWDPDAPALPTPPLHRAGSRGQPPRPVGLRGAAARLNLLGVGSAKGV
ncbi:MAG: ribbon-helix-helix protein, CopG family [Deltaproteobacteria bacterium]|nr:MAG: ribbon-helix-helix protein, CopG family [Deltaproteobacteria bacterium]